MKLTDLNIDCLVRIFKYCTEDDLLNLCFADAYLCEVIDENIFYFQTLDLLMCGHRNAPHIQQRTNLPLTHADRLGIARNWLCGRYCERQYFHHSHMFSSKLHLDYDYLYMTNTGYLRQYRRLMHEPLERRYHKEISTGTKTDIGAFVKKRDTLFAGRICGNCFIYEAGSTTEQRLHAPKDYLFCLDFAGDLYATSTEGCVRLWRRSDQFGLLHLDLLSESKNSFKALKLTEDGQLLIGGLYTDVNRRALREVDVESGVETIRNSNTISVYDLKLKDEHVIFTANFDTTFRMHDRRTNRDEGIWEDPFDSSFYCLEYDGLHAVLCGTKYHGRVNLYDIRVPGKYVQLYFPRRRTQQHYESPVYSMACDSRYLFIATAHNLRVFDFKADNCELTHDYRNIFSEVVRKKAM